jgi:hypothetical protein
VKVISWVALAGVILPGVLYLSGGIRLEAAKAWMIACTVLWFVTVPLWMGRR